MEVPKRQKKSKRVIELNRVQPQTCKTNIRIMTIRVPSCLIYTRLQHKRWLFFAVILRSNTLIIRHKFLPSRANLSPVYTSFIVFISFINGLLIHIICAVLLFFVFVFVFFLTYTLLFLNLNLYIVLIANMLIFRQRQPLHKILFVLMITGGIALFMLQEGRNIKVSLSLSLTLTQTHTLSHIKFECNIYIDEYQPTERRRRTCAFY